MSKNAWYIGYGKNLEIFPKFEFPEMTSNDPK